MPKRSPDPGRMMTADMAAAFSRALRELGFPPEAMPSDVPPSVELAVYVGMLAALCDSYEAHLGADAAEIISAARAQTRAALEVPQPWEGMN